MPVHPVIDPVIFSIGPLELRWYGAMYGIGFLTSLWLANMRIKAEHSPVKTSEDVERLLVYVMLGVVIGGRLGYTLFYPEVSFSEDPLYVFKMWEGGMSFHGGLLGVMAGMWLFGRRLELSLWQVADFSAPFGCLGLGFGRIGNFINGELWGKPTDLPWGVEFQGQVLHPSQLYEAALEGFLLFAILWRFSSKPRPRLAVSGLFFLLYGVFRFAVEFVRLPDAHMGYLAGDWLTMGQVLSTPMILGGATMLALAYRRAGEAGR